MTTDLTGDFELGEEEFEWDVFAPEPDDAEIAAEAAALEDEDELDLDDSEFDWDAALREGPEPVADGAAGARAGAAYDRIVDTVRRSFEEPEPGMDPRMDPGIDVDPDPEAELRQEAWLPEAEFETDAEFELEEEPAWALEPDAAGEPGPELEPVEARIAEMAATVASVAPAESFPIAPSGTEPDVGPEWAAQSEDIGETAPADGLVPPPTRRSRNRTHGKREQNGRSRVLTATVVLACLLLVIVAAAAVVHVRHDRTAATTGAPAHAAPVASSSAETARIQAATDAVDSATTSASVGISSLVTFPTPSNVERVINPYISSLQLYGTLLSGSTVPASARSAASSVEAQVHQDLQFLDTIDALPPLQLGAFLKEFDTDATQLQTTLNALEQNLRVTAS